MATDFVFFFSNGRESTCNLATVYTVFFPWATKVRTIQGKQLRDRPLFGRSPEVTSLYLTAPMFKGQSGRPLRKHVSGLDEEMEPVSDGEPGATG